MRGKWAQGITPRHFTWVIKDKVAVCERPGGYGVNHRKVRRQEEIIWLRQNEFDFVMSLCGSSQNLHNYEEMGLPFHHVPFSGPAAGPLSLTRSMATIRDHVAAGDKLWCTESSSASASRALSRVSVVDGACSQRSAGHFDHGAAVRA